MLGFSPERESGGTIKVRAVDDGSPASGAGLRPGDVIVNWNGGDVPRSLARWVRERHPGEVVKVRVRRGEKEQTLEFAASRKNCSTNHGRLHAVEKARRIREGLLHGITQTVAVH
jgi:S1-C subfamily serine protease